jgi:hypothetical protein
MKSFKIKIVKAKESTYWYANKIGQVFEVVGASNDFGLSDSFLVNVEGDVETYLVAWNDCTLFVDDIK